MVDDVMCSSACPCDNEVADVTYMNDIANLDNFGSTGRCASDAGNCGNDIQFVFQAPGEGVFSTYKDCFNEVVAT